MTEPQTDPANQAGQPSGSGPPEGSPAGTGSAGSADMIPGTGSQSTGSPSTDTSTGGVTTASRTSAPQAAVPSQYSREQSAYGMGEQDEQIATPGLGAGGAVIAATAGTSAGVVLLGGLCMIAAGVILLVWPHATLTVVAILIGAALVASGLVRMFEGFTARGETGGMRTAYVVIGLLAILAGIYCLKNHALSILLVAFVTGVYFIVHGIADIAVAASADVPGRGIRAVLGVFSIAAGVIMVVWPGPTLVLLLTIVGAWLIFYGLLLAGLSFSLRRAAKSAAASSSPAPRLATSSR